VSVCGTHIHPDYAQAVLHADDDYHGVGKVSVTGGWSCPRARGIEAAADVYVNPLDYNAMLIGSAWDAAMEKYAPPAQRKLQVAGELAGVEVVGEIDRVRYIEDESGSVYLCVEDHKHGNNFAHKHAKANGVKLEHKLQLSIYGYLLGLVEGQRTPTHGIIWNHYSGALAGKTPDSLVLPFVFLLMPILECLNAKPFGSSYTVAELYQQAARNVSGEVRWQDLPLVGETMSFGKSSYCDYCQVRDACFTQAKGAPF
jgi:hypothetical protein